MLFLFFGVAGAVFGLDLTAKALFYPGVNINLIPGVISIHSLPGLNTGASFSIFSGSVFWLALFSGAVIVIGLIFYFRLRSRSVLLNIALGGIFGGALGNLYDRIFLGGVRDFFRLDFMDFPIFNVADVCLNIGFVLLAVWLLLFYKGANAKH